MRQRRGRVTGGGWRICRRWRALGLTFLLAFIPLTSAKAKEVSGFLTTSVNTGTTEIGGTSTDVTSLAQTFDINWNRPVSNFLRYRTSLRQTYSQDWIDVDSDEVRTWTLQLEPAIDVTLAQQAYSLNVGFRGREQINDGNIIDRVRLSDRRIFARLFLTPEDLPSLFFEVDRKTREDDRDPKTEDAVDTKYEVSTEYGFENFNFFYSFLKQTNEDKVDDTTLDRQNHVGTFAYSDSFFQDRLTVNGDYTVNYLKNTREFSVPAVAEIERNLQRVFWAANDTTPTDSSSVTFTDVGLGTQPVKLDTNVSVGFELAVRESVNQIRIFVAPAPPSTTLPPDLNSRLSFRVFFTDDATLDTWSEIGGVSQSFDSNQNEFTLNFSATTARFFKAFVDENIGVSVNATGITAFGSEQVRAGEERKDSTLLNRIGINLTATPVEWATASVNALLSNTNQDPGAEQTNGTLTASLTAELHQLLSSTFRYQHNFSNTDQPGVEDTTDDTFTLIFNSNPLPTLTSSLSLSRRESRSEGDLDTRTDTVSLNTSAELYRNLNLNSTYTYSDARDFTLDRKTVSHTLAIGSTATLTSRLSTVLSYALDVDRIEEPGLDDTTVTNIGTLSATYTVSRQLNLNGRIDFSIAEDTDSVTQTYSVDWIPTSKISTFVEYRRVDQDSTGSDSVTVNSRWNMSRFLSFDANFNYFRTFDGDTTQSLTGSFQFRF